MLNSNGVEFLQADGRPPKVLIAGKAPGESGVSVLWTSFRGGAYFSASTDMHLVFFHVSGPAPFKCRIAEEFLAHVSSCGTVAICPARVDTKAHADCGVDNLLIAIDPGILSLAAAEDGALGAELVPQLSGQDRELTDLARTLATESAVGYPNGALYWNDVATGFIAGILARHTSHFEGHKIRGTLSKNVLSNLREYIETHLHEPIDVGTLAGIAGRSPYHFCRVFTGSVGVTPHRYVVHLRLRRALELVQEGRHGLADIAMQTGFADQSHLSRWVRRVHGVSPRQLAP